MNKKFFLCSVLIWSFACVTSLSSCTAAETGWDHGRPAPKVEPKYLLGGPIEGIELSPSKRGPYPQVELYPGAVEQWRSYWMKYTPSRSLYDAQSLLRLWNAADMSGVPADRVSEFAPSGNFEGAPIPAARVVRAGVKNPVFRLELGNLPIGMYAIRTIAAVPKEEIRTFRKPLYFTVRVNDKPGGEWSTYRQRISYTDDFYSVSEVFFHADEARSYRAEIFVDDGSEVELLIHNFTLDNALAGNTFQAIKQKRTLTTPAELARIKAEVLPDHIKILEGLKELTPQERLQRDEMIWKYLPPVNAQGMNMHLWAPENATAGTSDKTQEQIESEWGKWESGLKKYASAFYGVMPLELKPLSTFLVNEKLGLEYSIDDLHAKKPLPDPYPYKDAGAGLYFPDPKDGAKGRYWTPVGVAEGERLRGAYGIAKGSAKVWAASNNKGAARDAAINLIRYAYEYPSYDLAHSLQINMAEPGYYQRDVRFRQRHEYFLHGEQYPKYTAILETYDLLFPYIKGNEELAKSVGRFVPWVKTSDDVIKLIDTYMVQHIAKRIMRYQWYTVTPALAKVAAAMDDPKVTKPWMDWLFTKAFQYPLPTAGLPDLMISANGRNGVQYIGSTFYGGGEGARVIAGELEPYLKAGGLPEFNLADPKRYPKTLAHAWWDIQKTVGGHDFLRIGDVTGPEKTGIAFLGRSAGARDGWQWSGDPRFAWMLKHVVGRTEETDEEWAKIDAAANSVKRAPYLDLPSRVLGNWAGILESGLEHDDYRFRRAAYVRAGLGYGHEHADTLDLQIFAHGLPMTVDDGQRSGYSKPNSKFSRVHNTAEVNGGGNSEYGVWTHAWVENLTDAPGAQYQRVSATPPPGAKYFNRQVALIDVDEGVGSKQLTVEQQKPGAELPKGVTTPNSYVFDVFRISGGEAHTYNFHGPVNDEFEWNAQNVKPVETVAPNLKPKTEADYLSIFERKPETKMAGDAPSTLEATWRMTRDEKIGAFAGEQAHAGKNYDPASPRKYTRLHLLGANDLRALRANIVSQQFNYEITNLTALKTGENLESAFTAIIEPYVGEPFISAQRVLPVANNESDALRAVAVEVKTKNGHSDVNFADGRPEKTRQVGNLKFSGEYALYSTDANGLRQATLSGGTLLSTPLIQIEAEARERRAQVLNVNYAEKRLQLDQAWPAAAANRVFEIGTPQKWTSYTNDSVNGQVLTVTEGADFYRSGTTQVLPAENRVDGKLTVPVWGAPGLSNGWTMSNDDASKFWRVTKREGNDFWLDKPMTQEEIAPSGNIRLWEYGPGDTARQSTFVSLRRIGQNLYELRGDVDVSLALTTVNEEWTMPETRPIERRVTTRRPTKIEFSIDALKWRPLTANVKGEFLEVSVGLSKLASQPVYLRAVR